MAYDDSALTLLVWLFIGLPSRLFVSVRNPMRYTLFNQYPHSLL